MSKINCSQIDIRFVKTRVDGNDFCYARITEVCTPVTGGKLIGYPKSYRYEPCDGYLWKGSALPSSNNNCPHKSLIPLQAIVQDLNEPR